MADFDTILQKLEFSGAIDPSEFFFKLLLPEPGQADPLESLRLGFRKRIVEPCFEQISLLYQTLERDAKKPQTKKKLSQLLNPIDPKEITKISQEYKESLQKVLGVSIETFKDNLPSKKAKKTADPFNLLVLAEEYQTKVKEILHQNLKKLEHHIDSFQPSLSGNLDQTVISNKNTKDAGSNDKKPTIKLVPTNIEQANKPNVPEIPDFTPKKETNRPEKGFWSIEQPKVQPKEHEQANLEPAEIIVTLSNKSLKDLNNLWLKLGGLKPKLTTITPTASSSKVPDSLNIAGMAEVAGSKIAEIAAKWIVLPGVAAALGFATGGWLNRILDTQFEINKKFADWWNKDIEDRQKNLQHNFTIGVDESKIKVSDTINRHIYETDKSNNYVTKNNGELIPKKIEDKQKTSQTILAELEKNKQELETKNAGYQYNLDQWNKWYNIPAKTLQNLTSDKSVEVDYGNHIDTNNASIAQFRVDIDNWKKFQKEMEKNPKLQLSDYEKFLRKNTKSAAKPLTSILENPITPYDKDGNSLELPDSGKKTFSIPEGNKHASIPPTIQLNNIFADLSKDLNQLVESNKKLLTSINNRSEGSTTNNQFITQNSSKTDSSKETDFSATRDQIYEFRNNRWRDTPTGSYT